MPTLHEVIEDFKSRENATSLYLADVDFSDPENVSVFPELVELIKASASITNISFIRTNLWKQSFKIVQPIFEAIRDKKSPLEVDLSCNHLGNVPELFVNVFACLISSPSKVCSLRLIDNELFKCEREIERLYARLDTAPFLKELYLESNRLGELSAQSLRYLAAIILKFNNLILLNLGNNALGSNAAILGFVEEIITRMQIKQLDFSANLKDVASDTIVECLALLVNSRSIATLDLSFNVLYRIGVEKLGDFFDQVLSNKQLMKLDLTANDFSSFEDVLKTRFIEVIAFFIQRATGQNMEVTYEKYNFDLEEGQQISKLSKVSSSFWREMARVMQPESPSERAVEQAFQLLRADETIKRFIVNPDNLRSFMSMLGEKFRSACEREGMSLKS